MQKKLIILSGVFVAALIIANVMAAKLFTVAGVAMTVSIIVFPLTFILTDVITEVWGRKVAVTVVWTGFLANVLMVIMFQIGRILPAAPFWEHQEAYVAILGAVPRMVLASMVAYLASQFNDVLLFSALKKRTKGKHLWLRNNASTMVSQLIDSTLFLFIAFAGTMPVTEILKMLVAYYIAKVIFAAIDTPVVYFLVNLVKE